MLGCFFRHFPELDLALVDSKLELEEEKVAKEALDGKELKECTPDPSLDPTETFTEVSPQAKIKVSLMYFF